MKPINLLLKDILEVGRYLYDIVEEEIPITVKNIVDQQHLMLTLGVPDRSIWTANLTDIFSVAAAWECLKQKKERSNEHKH